MINEHLHDIVVRMAISRPKIAHHSNSNIQWAHITRTFKKVPVINDKCKELVNGITRYKTAKSHSRHIWLNGQTIVENHQDNRSLYACIWKAHTGYLWTSE